MSDFQAGAMARTQGWRLGWVALISLLLVISRRPDVVLHAQFWAEDGKYWYKNAYDLGPWMPLLQQQNGYLQTVSRLIADLGLLMPLAWVPLFFNLCALGFQILPVLLLYSGRGRQQVPDRLTRALISLFYLGHPYSTEVHANVTNIQWHLAVAAAMVLAFPESRVGWVRKADAALLGLASLSGPFGLFLAPLAVALAAWRREVRSLAMAVWISVLAGLQALLILAHHGAGDRFTATLGASPGLLIQIFSGKVVLAACLGDHMDWLYDLPAWSHGWLPALVAVTGLTVCIAGAIRGPILAKVMIALGLMVFAATLLMPQLSARLPQWSVYVQPGNGGRYSFIPVLGFYAALFGTAAACRGLWLRSLAVALLGLTVLAGIAGNWRMQAWPDLQFQRYAQLFQQAPPGTEVDIPVNPNPFWILSLRKK